ncbi:LutC/YkgG family protein [Sulfurospirillum sp. 1612]|uniref:LutC/YkgG family protein n=1 Tax=Sulfurospirillum sp. 1612 TaxID=3094835 RepID=UPI002F91FE3B
MTSKAYILDQIRTNIAKQNTTQVALPDLEIAHDDYHDKDKQFAQALQSVGGMAHWLDTQENIETFIQEHYQHHGTIATSMDLQIEHINPNDVQDPHELKNVDLAVVKGEFAVAENAAVWLQDHENINRSLYFIAQRLLIVVKKEHIVASMHEAYEQINFKENTFGTFISGPSKTADIEQALVIGAHGAMECMVLFI